MKLAKRLRTLLKLEVLEARHLPATAGLACGLLSLFAGGRVDAFPVREAVPASVPADEWRAERPAASAAPAWLADAGEMPRGGGFFRDYLVGTDAGDADNGGWDGYAVAL